MIFCRKNTLRSRKSQTKSIQMKFVVFLMWSTTKNRPNIRAHAIPVTTQTTVNAIKCVSCTNLSPKTVYNTKTLKFLQLTGLSAAPEIR